MTKAILQVDWDNDDSIGTHPEEWVLSGNEITDVKRLAALTGDGRAYPDGSMGIWKAATNLCTNGGIETNMTGWSTLGTNTIARSTAQKKFGAASLIATYQDNTNLARFGITITAVAHVGSVWVYIPSDYDGGGVRMLASSGFVGNTILNSAHDQADMSKRDQWQRIWHSFIPDAGDLAGFPTVLQTGAAPTAGKFIYVDGLQIEVGYRPSPYIETDGATAVRAKGRIQASASLLDETQGWFAFRFRPGWDTASEPSGGASLEFIFAWLDDGVNVLYCFYNEATNALHFVRAVGGANTTVTLPWSPEYEIPATIVIAWTATQLKLSLDGGAFASIANTHIPTLAATLFDFGSGGTILSPDKEFDGDILWAAWGTGTLSDADAAFLHATGDDGPVPSQLPSAAACKAVWDADTEEMLLAEDDVTGDCLSVEARLGRDYSSQLLGKGVPAKLSATLLNIDGDYSPFETSSPLYGLTLPGRKVRLRTVNPAHTLGTFYLDRLLPETVEKGLPKARLTAFGALSRTAQAEIFSKVSEGELTGELIHKILNQTGIAGVTVEYAGISPQENSGYGTAGGNSTYNAAAADDAEAGDQLIMFVVMEGLPTFGTSPAVYGFTQVGSTIDNGASMRASVWTKKHSGSEPSHYFLSKSTGLDWHVWVIALRGQRAITDISAIDIVSGLATVSGTNHATPSITTTEDGEILVGFFAVLSETSWTPPAGMAERGDDVAGVGIAANLTSSVATVSQTLAGASGAKTATCGVAGVGIAILVGVKSASPISASSRRVDLGTVTAGKWAVNKKGALQALDEVVVTEGGFLYDARDGAIVFEDAHHRLSGAHLVSQAEYSDDPAAEFSYTRISELDPLQEVFTRFTVPVQTYTQGGLSTLWQYTELENPPYLFVLAPNEFRRLIAQYPNPDDVTGAWVKSWTTPVKGSDVTVVDLLDGTIMEDYLSVGAVKYGNRMLIQVGNSHPQVHQGFQTLRAQGVPYTLKDPLIMQAEDSEAQLKYGIRTLALPTNYIPTTRVAQDRADFLLAKHKEPRPIITCGFKPGSNSAFISELLERDISDRVTLVADNRSKLGIDQDFWIEAITYRVRPQNWFEVEFELSDASFESELWLIGTSLLGTSTRLGV